MTEDDKTPPVKTVKLSEAAIRRGDEAYRASLLNPPALTPAEKAMREAIQNPPKLTRAEQAYRDVMLNPPKPDPLEKAKREFVASQDRFRGFAQMYEASDTTRGLRSLGSAFDRSVGVRAATNLNQAFKGIDFSRMFPEPPYAAALKKQIAEMSGANRVTQRISSQIMPGIAASMLAGIKVPSVEDMIGRDFLKQLGSIQAEAMAILERQSRTISSFPRPIAAPSRTPARERVEVRRFLERLDLRLLKKLDGVYDVLDLSDGTCQSANSGAELMKRMTFALVPYADVQAYARRTYGIKARLQHSVELMSIRYSMDPTILMTLTNSGMLGSQFHDIKHDEFEMDADYARSHLLELIDQLEDLLVFLAQSFDR